MALQWSQAAILFPNGSAKTVELQVKANIAKAAGKVQIQTPPGWKISAQSGDFHLTAAGEQSEVSFEVTPPSDDAQGKLASQRAGGGSNRRHSDGDHQLPAHSYAGFVSTSDG